MVCRRQKSSARLSNGNISWECKAHFLRKWALFFGKIMFATSALAKLLPIQTEEQLRKWKLNLPELRQGNLEQKNLNFCKSRCQNLGEKNTAGKEEKANVIWILHQLQHHPSFLPPVCLLFPLLDLLSQRQETLHPGRKLVLREK